MSSISFWHMDKVELRTYPNSDNKNKSGNRLNESRNAGPFFQRDLRIIPALMRLFYNGSTQPY